MENNETILPKEFIEWIKSGRAERFDRAFKAVDKALEKAKLDIPRRRIIWPDGKRLTIAETIDRIYETDDLDLDALKSNVILWMETESESHRRHKKDWDKLDRWIEDFYASKSYCGGWIW